MRRSVLVLFSVMVLVLAACGARASTQQGEEQAETTLEVDNQASLDMVIYVVRTSGERQRLGTATAHTRSSFTIPDRLIFGLTPLRFQADPIGGNRAPVSQEITVEPGGTVVLRIPPA